MTRTPLNRRTPMKRGTTPLKRTPLNHESPRHRAERLAWAPVRAAAFAAAGGRCVFTKNGRRCPKPAREGHHKRGKAQGGNAETTVCVPLCLHHHRWCGEHSREAARLGYVERRSDFDPIQKGRAA